jgi:hypothetical protein
MFDRSAVHLTGDVERVIYTQSEDGTFRLPQDVRRESIAMVVVRYETKIDPHSVEGCPELQRVIVCPPVETIGDHAFANCQKLSNVQLYETTTEIGERAFLQCNSLKDITLPASIRIIGEGAFYNTGISNVTIKRVSSFLGKSDKDICEQLSLFLGDDRVDAGGTCTVTFEANNKKEKQFRLDYKTGKWQVSGRLKWWAVS